MTTDYALYLESGPKHRKTMVHVLALLGCVAVGATSEAAVQSSPEALSAFRRFLERTGEDVDPDAPFTVHVEEHITEGTWLGNGDPYIAFAPDLEPLSQPELEHLTDRAVRLREELAAWADSSTPEALAATAPGSSRTSQAILLHALGPTGAYAAPVIGTVSGMSALHRQAEQGQISLGDALRQSTAILAPKLWAATEVQRTQPVARSKEVRTLRKALRRTLEHDWEHLAELSRRPGGPRL